MERRFHFSCSHLWQGQFRSLAARGWTVLPSHLWTGQSPWVKCTISSSSIQGYISKQHFWFSWSYCKNRLMYILTACTPWMIPLVSTATLCVLHQPVEDEIHISYFGGVNSGHFYKVNMFSKLTYKFLYQRLALAVVLQMFESVQDEKPQKHRKR